MRWLKLNEWTSIAWHAKHSKATLTESERANVICQLCPFNVPFHSVPFSVSPIFFFSLVWALSLSLFLSLLYILIVSFSFHVLLISFCFSIVSQPVSPCIQTQFLVYCSFTRSPIHHHHHHPLPFTSLLMALTNVLTFSMFHSEFQRAKNRVCVCECAVAEL